MPLDDLVPLAVLFLFVGALYASVGHAGASGYLAAMALLGVAPEAMRPTALSVNVVVASIAFGHYLSAGHFSWRFLLPFAAASLPMAFIGAAIPVPENWLRAAIGVTLAFAAIRMLWTNLKTSAPRRVEDPPLSKKLVAGGVIGFAAGLTGTGGGIFLSPLLLICGWAEPRRVAATASLFILANSLSGLAGIALSGWAVGLAPVPLAAAAAVGGAVGGYLGSRRATPRTLNLLLAAVLGIAAVKLIAGVASAALR